MMPTGIIMKFHMLILSCIDSSYPTTVPNRAEVVAGRRSSVWSSFDEELLQPLRALLVETGIAHDSCRLDAGIRPAEYSSGSRDWLRYRGARGRAQSPRCGARADAFNAQALLEPFRRQLRTEARASFLILNTAAPPIFRDVTAPVSFHARR